MVSAVRNGLYNSLANVAGAATGIVGSVLIVNSLSAQAYGQFSYYLWLAGILGLLGTLAFPVSLIKLISELRGQGDLQEARNLTRWVLVRTSLLNLALTLGLFLWASNAPPEQRLYLYVLAAFPFFNALARVLSAVLWGYERYKEVSFATAVAALIQLALTAVFYFFIPRGWAYALAMLSSSFFITMGLTVMLRRTRKVRQEQEPQAHGEQIQGAQPPTQARTPLTPATLRRYTSFLIPATPGLIFQILVWDRSEIFFLNLMSTVEQIGYYSLAYTLFRVFLGLGWSLVNGYFPSMSHDYGSGNMKGMQEKIRTAVLLATVFSVPLSFGAWASFEGIFGLIYGEKMLPAVPVAYILFAGLVPGVVSSVFGSVIAAANRMWLSLWINFVLAAVNIALDLLLIASYGAVGAAFANTGAQLGAAVLSFFVLKRVVSVSLPWGSLSLIVLIGVLSTYALPWLIQMLLPGTAGLLLAIVVAALLYPLSLWKLGFLAPFFNRSPRLLKPALEA